jgi:predicted Zn finger-like uncharacterized protein
MRVACSRCKTAHDIPPEKLSDEVLKIRCTRCGHVFGVRKKKEEAPRGKEASPAPGSAQSPIPRTSTAAPTAPASATPAASAPPAARPPLPDDDFEEGPHDIHWLDEIDIPKIDDVIQAVQNKMAAAAAAAPAVTPARPRAAPVPPPPAAAPVTASPPKTAPSPQPDASPAMPGADAARTAPPPRPAPKPAPAVVPQPPHASAEQASRTPSGPEAPSPAARRAPEARPASAAPPPKTSRAGAAKGEPVSPFIDAPPRAVVPPARRRIPAAGVVFVVSFLLCAGAAGFVAATRPETFPLLAARIADPAGGAAAEFVLDEPVIGAQLSRPDKRPLFVITGWIRSAKGAPLPPSVRVEGRLFGVGGMELASGEASCGTLLTENDLGTLADSEILSRLRNAPAVTGDVTRMPFMVVIPDPPRGVEGHAERIVPPGSGG